MKQTSLNHVLTCALVLVMSSLMFASQAIAKEGPGTGANQPPGATQSRGDQRELKFSENELEQLRTELLNFVHANKELAATFGLNKEAEVFQKCEEQLRQLSLKQLDGLRNALPDTASLSVSAQRVHDGLEMQRLVNNIEVSPFSGKSKKSFQTQSAGFPGAAYPSCGSTRKSEAVVDASDTALFVAEGVRDAASRACDEVIVILGEGGNGSLVCIATDAIYVAAKAVNYALHFCNDKIDQAEMLASYSRLSHIHGDIESSVANDNSNKTAIIDNDNSNKTAIINNDNSNTTSIIASVNAGKGDIINNANSNTEVITTAIADAKTFLLRTQIEADLAEADSATPVALYLTPNANGGHLDFVQTIVTQTIANIQAAGGATGQAQALLTQANAAKAAGNFKDAYALYRKAYKAAAK